MARRRRRGACYSLVELLVTLGLLSMLAALLFPCFAAARARARQTVCRSNLRQIGQALSVYVEDYGDFPIWIYQLHPSYVTDKRLFVCPADPLLHRGGWMQAGLWQLFAIEPSLRFAAPRYNMSYCDFGYLNIDHMRAGLLASESGAYTACVLHGTYTSSDGSTTTGKVLRLRFDGSVKCCVVQQPLGHMDLWSILCDDLEPSDPWGR